MHGFYKTVKSLLSRILWVNKLLVELLAEVEEQGKERIIMREGEWDYSPIT